MEILKRPLCSTIVLKIMETVEKYENDDDCFVDINVGYGSYEQHNYGYTEFFEILINYKGKLIPLIDCQNINPREARAVRVILKNLGGIYKELAYHWGEHYNYKKERFVPWTAGDGDYMVRNTKLGYPLFSYHGTLEEIKTICDFLNCTNIVKMK